MAKLIKLHLENYRNIKAIDFNFEGKDGKIVGANRVGKTNVLESICFLLSDKLLGGSADIPAIKNHKDPRAIVVVEGTFSTTGGDVVLRKEFYEKWVRPRGSATEELTGHATDYYINGAKQARAKDFFEQLTSKFGIPTDFNNMDAYQLVIDPFYLPQIICDSKDWKLARKSIIEIVGDVTPEEIYGKDGNAKIAKADLERHQYDDGEAKKAIRGEIESFKNRMISNEGLLAEYGKAEDVIQADYDSAKKQDEEASEQIAKLNAGVANPFVDELSRLNNELYNLQREYQKIALAPIDHSASEALRKEKTEKENKLIDFQRNKAAFQCDLDSLKTSLSLRKEDQKAYLTKLRDFGDRFKSVMVEDVCPTCGQKLPENLIKEAFNKKQAEIKAEAQPIHDKALENQKAIKELEAKLEIMVSPDFEAEETVIKVDINELDRKLKEALASEANSVRTPDPKINARIAEINARIAEINAVQSKGDSGKDEQISALKTKKDSLQVVFSKRISYQNAQRRIEELKKDQVELGKGQADAEQRLWAVGEFVKAKLGLLDEHMASKLGEVRFQLIKENIKAGSYDEVCTPYIISPETKKHTSTLFDSGSKSEQIYTGCQIIKAIRNAKHWEPLPVLFDQGGELDSNSVNLVSMDSEAQIIAVKVEGSQTIPTFVPFEN